MESNTLLIWLVTHFTSPSINVRSLPIDKFSFPAMILARQRTLNFLLSIKVWTNLISIDISEIWIGQQEDTVIYQSPVYCSCQTEYIPQCQILYILQIRSASFDLRAHNIDPWAKDSIIFIRKYKFALLISQSIAFPFTINWSLFIAILNFIKL